MRAPASGRPSSSSAFIRSKTSARTRTYVSFVCGSRARGSEFFSSRRWSWVSSIMDTSSTRVPTEGFKRKKSDTNAEEQTSDRRSLPQRRQAPACNLNVRLLVRAAVGVAGQQSAVLQFERVAETAALRHPPGRLALDD